MDAIADYYRSRIDPARPGHCLDDRPWDDLNLDAVFQVLDRAESTLGQQVFDELFRGTNTVERIAGAEAVLTELVLDRGRFKPHLVLAATHDGELVELLSEIYASCHVGDELGSGGLIFDHRLRPGAATTRNAIALLRLHGAPPAMVTRALQRATVLDRLRGSAPAGR